jgi:hypothetical protein
MTERFSALLDDAVSEVQPRLADPVPVLIRRARAQRFKATAAGALAAVALLGGGFAVSNELIAANQAQDAAGRSTEPPTPRVVDGKIVAGGLILPVPPGWKVVERKAAKSCGMLANTVLIGGPDDVGCATAPIEVSGTRGPIPGGIASVPANPGGAANTDHLVISIPKMITLPGGEPAWQTLGSPGLPNTAHDPHGYQNWLTLPWSNVLISLRGDRTEQQKVINSMRSKPVKATRLVLPKTAKAAELAIVERTIPVTATQTPPDGDGRSTDPKTITTVLRLLRGQTPAADSGHGCADGTQPTAQLTLRARDIRLSQTQPRGDIKAILEDTTTIIITLSDNCREAASSRGGRVTLSASALAQLKKLLNVGSR